jgi:hypothetical protein
MLTKIRICNFRSINKETIIDFEATKYGILSLTNTYNGVTKGSMFSGGNASGKKNIISSISLLINLLFLNSTVNMKNNFCFFSKDETLVLEYFFKFDENRIDYLIEFDKEGSIKKETLSLNNVIKLSRIELAAETDLTQRRFYDASQIDPRTLFLRSIYFNTGFTNFPILSRWFNFLSNSITFNVQRSLMLLANPELDINLSNMINIYQYLNQYGTDEINDFFKKYDFKQEIFYKDIDELKQEGLGDTLSTKQIYIKRTYLNQGIDINAESLGSRMLIQMLPSLFHSIKRECMFIIDDFNSLFHNELEELIIKYFMEKSLASQIFFVSHSTNLMKTTLLRPDQIYTVDFSDASGTRVKRVSSQSPRESQKTWKKCT